MRRLTTTLTNKRILRGTETFVFLGSFGACLRDTGGQLRTASADDDFPQSFEVERLDMFLSHSWHASWLLKYVCLLLYFNGQAALVAGIFVSLIVGPCMKNYVGNTDSFKHTMVGELFTNEVEGPDRNPADAQYVSLFMGLAAFHIVLFSWHRLRRVICPGSQSIFLDKVCIHQTDAELKALGIQSIGAILDNSDIMLIAWDTTYFERLWCTFELAAFSFQPKRRKMVFLPIMMVTVIGAYALLAQFIEVGRVLLVEMQKNVSSRKINSVEFELYFFWIPHTCMNLIFVKFYRDYARDHITLMEQVDNFSVRAAKCFCCCNAHINPSSGAPIPCDRELVNEAITRWYGDGDPDVALERFDQLIRNKLGVEVKELSPGLAQIPYHWVVISTFAESLPYIDYYDYDVFNAVYKFVKDGFFIGPFFIGSMMALAMCFPAPPLEGKCQSWASTCTRFIRERSLDVFIILAPSVPIQIYGHMILGFNLCEHYGGPKCMYVRLPLLLSVALINILLFTNWSFGARVASLREGLMDSESRRPSAQSSSSSRPTAPPPQPPTLGYRLSTRRYSAHSNPNRPRID